MVYITAIRIPSGSNMHEHITAVHWRNPQSGEANACSREQMIDWIDNQNGDARVQSPYGDVKVDVVRTNPPYLRTIANGRHTDNLLSLPRF
ncbi:DUF3892 domain-containing protein [Archangium violaceum]|uniref:DUF3892 domain-containing protein n=1 Tax=Archangium violaceum Cb vi76 TaxID=1406225 RepID=A0A084SPB7_9BACT|nr:DUF3892 domain-containing protein [Archangium violaceum]KFA90302.1 hypothetical protein Q664_29240 [Archangium violaceum Cb vi76]